MVYISIVTYNTDEKELSKLLQSFERVAMPVKIIIIDNSPTDKLKVFFKEYKFVEYIHNPSNPGFGAAHNIAIQQSIQEKGQYHFVVNPDVYFEKDIITPMVEYMQQNPEVGMLMPQVLNLDGTVQHLPKLLPSPYSILMRKLKFPKFIYEKFINRYELRNVDKNQIYEAPILSGCFTLFRVEALKTVGLYDDGFFMYFEDWDLSRRMHQKYKTIYFPLVSVYHGYESGANKSKRLFKIFVQSAKRYFNKWGWIFDKERRKVNRKTLKQFQ